MSNPNSKIVDRIRKLLALAADSGATEAEAALAAERARQMMEDHGLHVATVEAAGGTGEARTKDGSAGFCSKQWQRQILKALAEQSFCVVEVEYPKGTRPRWSVWGRESAVVTVKLMHEYLVKTVHRAVREVMGSTSDERFMRAMGERIAERIEEKHEAAMAAQKHTAERERESPTSSSNALVVVLEDYAQKERDLNEDMKRGVAPGTTERDRLQARLEDQRLTAEWERRQAEAREKREAKRQQLLGEGIDPEVVELMVYGYPREDAEKIVAKNRDPRHQERERKRQEREQAEYHARQQQRMRDYLREQSHPSVRAGRAQGDRVGLDAQVDQKETRRIK